MKISKSTKTILIVIGIIFLLAGLAITALFIFKPDLFVDFYAPSQDESSEDRTYIETESCITCEEKTDNSELEYDAEILMAGNIVWWDQSAGYNVMVENPDFFDAIMPFWYSFETNGSIKKTSYAENQTLINYCIENEILIIPTLSNGQTKAVSTAIFENLDTKESAISNAIKLIQNNNYDGIQLDFENMNADDNNSFSEFVKEIANQLHSIDKKLIVAVHAKSPEYGVWEGSAAHDWSQLNKYADYIMIMAYDYHWSTSGAGEIAPISWVRTTLNYAVDTIDKEKILLGIPLYGYDWVGTKASALDYTDVQMLINTYDITPEMTLEKEQYFTYEKNSLIHTVYYSDSQTVQERLRLVEEYNIAGASFWRLGSEDPDIYEE
jgi:spore germination protein YaaH